MSYNECLPKAVLVLVILRLSLTGFSTFLLIPAGLNLRYSGRGFYVRDSSVFDAITMGLPKWPICDELTIKRQEREPAKDLQMMSQY